LTRLKCFNISYQTISDSKDRILSGNQLSTYEFIFLFDRFQKPNKTIFEPSIANPVGVIDQHIELLSIPCPLTSC